MSWWYQPLLPSAAQLLGTTSFSATGSLSISAMTCSGSAEHGETFEATGSLNISTMTAAGVAWRGRVMFTLSSGNWADDIWDTTPSPTDYDFAFIQHNVTIAADLTLGHNPTTGDGSSGFCGEVQGVTLTVAAGVTFKLRAGLLLNSATLQVGTASGGATLEIDNSQASAAVNYMVAIGTANNQSSKLVTRGTSGSRSTIRSNSGGSNGFFGSTNGTVAANDRLESGRFDLEYTDFIRIGTASIQAIYPASVQAGTDIFKIHHCTFDNCGDITTVYQLGGNVNVDIQYSTWTNCLGSRGLRVNMYLPDGAPTATRNFIRNTVEKQAVLPIWNLVIEDNYFHDGWAYVAGGNARASSVARNVIRITPNSPDQVRSGDWDQFAFFIDGSPMLLTNKVYTSTADFNNPHCTTPVGAAEGTYAFRNGVVEDLGSTGDGDFDYGANQTNYHSVGENNIGLPSQSIESGVNLGAPTLATLNGWNGANCSYNHNTWRIGGQGVLALGEAGNGFADMVSSAKSNIAWTVSHFSSSSFNYFAYDPTPGTLVNDSISAGEADYNGMFGVRSDGTNGRYDIPTTGSYGANDVIGDPDFVDDTRNLTTWITSVLGGTHPLTGSPTRYDWNSYALYLLSLHNRTSHADYNSNATLERYLGYIREGFRPQNENYRAAGHDGKDIGAVSMAAQGVLNISAMTVSGSATFEGGAFEASGTLTISVITASGSATFDAPVYTGSGTLTVTNTTASGSATFDAPVYTASGTVSVPVMTASGSATFSIEFAATGALTVSNTTLSGSATFPFIASGAVVISNATASGSATFDLPVYTGSGTLGITAANLSGSATFPYTASGAFGISNATAAGSATFDAPVYTASGAVSVSSVTLSGSASFSSEHMASGALSIANVEASGSASFPFIATAALAVSSVTLSGNATFTAPTYTASGVLSVSAATAAGLATFTAPTFAATGALAVSPVTLSGSATFTSPSFAAVGSLLISNTTISGIGLFPPTAVGAFVVTPMEAAGLATHITPPGGLVASSGPIGIVNATIMGVSTISVLGPSPITILGAE